MERKDETNNSVSVLEGDKYHHLNKIISRASSVGLSSRIYYRNSEGVPFKWEMQPGKAKNLPRKEVVLPPSPPPAVQSRWLAKHTRVANLHYFKESKRSIALSKLRFWKRSKKNKDTEKIGEVASAGASKKYEIVEFGDSDVEFTGSGNDFRSSPSSYSSSSNGHSSSNLHPSRFGSADDHQKAFNHIPWNVTDLLNEEDEQGQRTACANENDGVLFRTNIYSRDSSVNQSSGLYYQTQGGVPFQWEKFPGTSKNPDKAEIVPPPSPPPAVQSLGLSTPALQSDSSTTTTTTNTLRLLWKKCKLKPETRNNLQEFSLHKFQKTNIRTGTSLASASVLSVQFTKIWRKKPSCYGAGKPRSIACSAVGDSEEYRM